MDTKPNARCDRCGAPMICNPGDCWCQQLPPALPPDPALSCYCESCLKSLIEASGRHQSTVSSDKSA